MSARDRKLLMILVPVAVFALYWMLLLNPALDRRARTCRSRSSTAQTERDAAVATAHQMTQAKLNYKEDYAELVKLSKAIPQSVAVSDLMRELNAAAEGMGIEFSEHHDGCADADRRDRGAEQPAAPPAERRPRRDPGRADLRRPLLRPVRPLPRASSTSSRSPTGSLEVHGRLIRIDEFSFDSARSRTSPRRSARRSTPRRPTRARPAAQPRGTARRRARRRRPRAGRELLPGSRGDAVKLDLNLDVVKDFALDVWEDLGRTRLAGVAVGLAVALLVITGVALLPGGGPRGQRERSPVIPTTPPPRTTSTFTVPERGADEDLRHQPVGSARPVPARSTASPRRGDQTLLPAGQRDRRRVMGTDSSCRIDDGPDHDAAPSSLMPLDDLSGTTTQPTTPTTPTEPHGDFDDETDEPAAAPVTDYSYTADVQFGRVDDLERYATVQRLGLLPSRQASADHVPGRRRRPRDGRLHGGLAPEPGRRGPLRAEGLALHVPRAERRPRRRTSTTSATRTATSTCCGCAASPASTATAGSLSGRSCRSCAAARRSSTARARAAVSPRTSIPST